MSGKCPEDGTNFRIKNEAVLSSRDVFVVNFAPLPPVAQVTNFWKKIANK